MSRESVDDRQRDVRRNRLQFETSPYLLQHADNPVDWFPWCDEAFQKAEREDKPVFLSIGYSSCHWCHVMEEESFEDPEIASVLNASFIGIKVDREERPDIDQVYMTMAQLVTGQGGWPLTVIMAPDGKPFFLGTYLPRQSSRGQLGLLQLLTTVTEHWMSHDKREELLGSSSRIVDVARSLVGSWSGAEFPADAWPMAVSDLMSTFDSKHGGFGGAPKFPMPTRLAFLLVHWHDSGDPRALAMVTKSLDEMRRGGMYDHLASGFHRYSVDERWEVPHFEKMLYDQALLVEVYLDAYLATGKRRYAETARDVIGYVLGRLTGPEGGFYCSEDADTEGEEGAYYLWSLRQLREVLSADELRVLLASAGHSVTDKPGEIEVNLREDQPFVLALRHPSTEVAESLHMSPSEVDGNLSAAKQALLVVRNRREPVPVDDKVSADWNGLAIAALARAGRVLDEPEFIVAAERAADFVMYQMRRDDGVLMHTYKDGRCTTPGFLEDYAFLGYGLLELFQAAQHSRHLQLSVRLTEQMLELFWDEADGGLFQTGTLNEQLLFRIKPIFDGALPSGNSMAGILLAKLARLTERPGLVENADRLFATLGKAAASHPSQFPGLLIGHRLHNRRTRVTVIVEASDAAYNRALIKTANSVYAPDHLLVVVPGNGLKSEAAALLPVARDHKRIEGRAAAYVCDRSKCSEPVAHPEALRTLLLGDRKAQ